VSEFRSESAPRRLYWVMQRSFLAVFIGLYRSVWITLAAYDLRGKFLDSGRIGTPRHKPTLLGTLVS
jgi:hypothetical protein